jgi:hypothetical protein
MWLPASVHAEPRRGDQQGLKGLERICHLFQQLDVSFSTSSPTSGGEGEKITAEDIASLGGIQREKHRHTEHSGYSGMAQRRVLPGDD